jgi:basic membrane protein A and related proteins
MRIARCLVVLVALSFFSSCGAEASRVPQVQEGAVPSIGIVLDLGGRADLASNMLAYQGLLQFVREQRGRIIGDDSAAFGTSVDVYVLELRDAASSREALVRSLAEEGRNLVIALGFLFSDSMASVARDYPKTDFLLIDGHVPDLRAASNLTCVQFAEHEAAFIVGAYAGLYAARQGSGSKLGFIGGMDLPISQKYLSGFSAGAATTNPALRPTGSVLYAFVDRSANAYIDPKRASEFASVLYQQGGSALVFAASGASNRGVAESAARFGRKLISADADLQKAYAASDDPALQALSGLVLGSALKRVDRAVYEPCKDLMDGFRLVGGYKSYDLANDGVGYLLPELDEADASLIAALAERLKQGALAAPANSGALADYLRTL